MKKNLFAVAMALTLGVGAFSACSSEDVQINGRVGEATSNLSLELSMPTGTRALDDDYRKVGEWAGKDDINAIQVFVFDNTAGTLEAAKKFVRGEFNLAQKGGVVGQPNQAVIRPLKAIKVAPGAKSVYVVVNPTAETEAYLNGVSVEGTTTLADFQTKYQGIYTVAETNFTAAPTGAFQTNAEKIAKTVDIVGGTPGDLKDQILMTGTLGTVTVIDGVSEQQTLADATKNRAVVTVARDVARVMISTSGAGTFEVKGDNPTTDNLIENDYTIATLSNLTYAVAQGERALYFQQRTDFQTPAYDFDSYSVEPGDPQSTVALEKYDYRGLWKEYKATGISGQAIPTTSLYHTDASKITAALETKLSGEFILPNIHAYGDADNTKYRKGNTAYILVRALMTPAHVYTAAGAGVPVAGDTYYGGTPKNLYLGENGRFYDSNETAHDVTKGGVAGQTTTLYKYGKVIYYAWINPDIVDGSGRGWLNSPVVRNNIYHVEITGFKRIGANWNPLVPNTGDKPVPPTLKPGDPGYDPNQPPLQPGQPGYDPNNPELRPNPNYPGPNPPQPNNPDPKPTPEENPFEPITPPVKPDEILTPKETWMSVDTRILPWKIHTYSTPLSL